MNKQFGQSDPRLQDWAYRTYEPEDDVLREIRARSVAEGLPDIQVAPLDGLHLEVFARAMGARRAVEVGTLGGYSGVCLLRGLPADGVLHTFELDAHHAAVARESFRRAGVLERARLHVGPALEHLREIEAEGPFDLMFLDADKVGYERYLEWAARHLRVGGVLLADNAFLFGRIVQDPESSPEVAAMGRFHRALARGGVFRSTILPTGEGLALGVKIR